MKIKSDETIIFACARKPESVKRVFSLNNVKYVVLLKNHEILVTFP